MCGLQLYIYIVINKHVDDHLSRRAQKFPERRTNSTVECTFIKQPTPHVLVRTIYLCPAYTPHTILMTDTAASRERKECSPRSLRDENVQQLFASCS